MVPVHFYLANKQLCWCYSVDCVLFLHSEASGGGLWVGRRGKKKFRQQPFTVWPLIVDFSLQIEKSEQSFEAKK